MTGTQATPYTAGPSKANITGPLRQARPAPWDSATQLLKEAAARNELTSPQSRRALSDLVAMLSDAANARNAARCLWSLSWHGSLQKLLADAALPGLANLIRDATNPDGAFEAAGAVHILASNSALSEQVAVAAVPALVSLLSNESNPRGRSKAASAMWQTSSFSDDVRRRVLETDGFMPALKSCMQDGSNNDGRYAWGHGTLESSRWSCCEHAHDVKS